MDPVSHVLLGRTLAEVTSDVPRATGSVAACVLGSLAPDIDSLLVLRGWDKYLAAHEIGTHTLTASPVVALAVALAVRLFARRTAFARLWTFAWVGVVVGHLMLDLVSGSEMRLFAPLWRERLGPHLLAMADVLAIAVLVLGAVLTRLLRRNPKGPRMAAVATLLSLALLLGVKAESKRRAWAVARGWGTNGGMPLSHPEAVNGSVRYWTFFERAGQDVRAWQVNAFTGRVSLTLMRRSADSDPDAIAWQHVQVVQTFRRLAAMPFVRIERNPEGRAVLWSDLRMCSATFCGLSFGVQLDGDGRFLRELVRIGPVEQKR